MKKRKKKAKKLQKFWLFFGIFLLTIFLGSFLSLDLIRINRKTLSDNHELPTIRLYLKDTTVDEMIRNSKEIKYSANYMELINQNEMSIFDDVEIKGRGNSTWGLAKSPFQIKLSQKANILGLSEAKKWLLIANFIDDTNLRNDTAYKFAEMLGEKYAVRGEFVRLYIDNEYEGLYYLTNKIEISKNSVDLRDFHGVLMEIDSLHRDKEDCIDTSTGVCMILKEAVMENDETVLGTAVQEFMDAYNAFEQAVRTRDYRKVQELVDVRSFAEYFLINEFAINPDAYCSSFYLYKDGERDKIHAGPVWDFDYALGNWRWVWTENTAVYSPYGLMPLKAGAVHAFALSPGSNALEIYYLMEFPEFQDEVKRLFREKLSGRADELIGFVKMRAALIRDEAIIDAEKWDFSDYDSNVEYLVDWIGKRFETFEEVYGR